MFKLGAEINPFKKKKNGFPTTIYAPHMLNTPEYIFQSISAHHFRCLGMYDRFFQIPIITFSRYKKNLLIAGVVFRRYPSPNKLLVQHACRPYWSDFGDCLHLSFPLRRTDAAVHDHNYCCIPPNSLFSACCAPLRAHLSVVWVKTPTHCMGETLCTPVASIPLPSNAKAVSSKVRWETYSKNGRYEAQSSWKLGCNHTNTKKITSCCCTCYKA